MPNSKKTTPKSKKAKAAKTAPGSVLYLYAIARVPKGLLPSIAAEGIDGSAKVEAIVCEGHVCWISRVPRDQFADDLAARMQDLEWLASAGLRHQRVVGEIAGKLTSLPARFGTVFLNEDSMAQHVVARKSVLRAAFKRVAEADEWGIKLFAVAPKKSSPVITGVSGSDYLKRRAEVLRPQPSKILDPDVRAFIASLDGLAVASSPGGKASVGQPGLIWHGSFLIRREDRAQLERILKKYASKWHTSHRIDWSGPWPPYSFVGDHGR
jgi:Gas vesicle synthesis protein GvpL/GvpF